MLLFCYISSIASWNNGIFESSTSDPHKNFPLDWHQCIRNKKLSLLELDSWLSIDAAIIRHSLWYKALDHNPCEQISGAWQCPVNSVSWLDNLCSSDPAPHRQCHSDVTWFLQHSFPFNLGLGSLYLFIDNIILLGYWWNIMWLVERATYKATCQFSLCFQLSSNEIIANWSENWFNAS